MNEKLIIRAAVKDDAFSIHRLLGLIANLHREGRPDMYPNLTSKYTVEQVIERISKEDSGVFVAEFDNNVAGYVFCDIIKEGDGYTVYVDDLCVDPNFRKGGIGRALMDKAADYGREKGCRYLMLNVWEFNKTALDFYQNYGLETRSRHLEMSLLN